MCLLWQNIQCLGGAFLLELAGCQVPIHTRNDNAAARCRHKIKCFLQILHEVLPICVCECFLLFLSHLPLSVAKCQYIYRSPLQKSRCPFCAALSLSVNFVIGPSISFMSFHVIRCHFNVIKCHFF
jgi:hypothetical protein